MTSSNILLIVALLGMSFTHCHDEDEPANITLLEEPYPNTTNNTNTTNTTIELGGESHLHSVPVTETLITGLINPQEVLFAGGDATNPYPRALAAASIHYYSPWEMGTYDLLTDIHYGLQYVLQTNNKWTFALHGGSHAAISAIMDNFIEPGDTVLIPMNGFWSDMAGLAAHQFGAHVVNLTRATGDRLSLNEGTKLVIEHLPKILYLVHGDSTVGIIQSLEGFGELCRRYNCCLIVDVIGTVGQIPILMDERKIDVAIMSSDRGIGAIYGLSAVSFSPRAVEMIKSRNTPTRLYHMQMERQAHSWFLEKTNRTLHNTYLHPLSFPLLYSLREALASIADEGIEQVWERHRLTNEAFIKEVQKLGLKYYFKRPTDKLPGITFLDIPNGKDVLKMDLIEHAWVSFQIEISPGAIYNYGKVIRVGLYGVNAHESAVTRVANALHQAQDAEETMHQVVWNHTNQENTTNTNTTATHINHDNNASNIH